MTDKADNKYCPPHMQWGKNVGEESRKSWDYKYCNGFFTKYMSGNGLDVGGRGYIGAHAILPSATLVDLDYPGYDGKTLPFEDNSQDYVYNSHTLEHISDYKNAIREWLRVVRKNSYVVIVVPHRDLYENKLELPSKWNGDHKRFYTPASLLQEVEDSLPVNSYRVRHLRDNDFGHVYGQPDKHGAWQYEIELVLQKL